jgi:hypothetical protein
LYSESNDQTLEDEAKWLNELRNAITKAEELFPKCTWKSYQRNRGSDQFDIHALWSSLFVAPGKSKSKDEPTEADYAAFKKTGLHLESPGEKASTEKSK